MADQAFRAAALTLKQAVAHARADERRKVIAELTSEETIGFAVQAAFYRGDEPDGRWFELTRDQQEECWAVMGAVIEEAASLLAPEGEGGHNLSAENLTPAPADASSVEPRSPEPAREGGEVPTYEMGAAGARFITAEEEPWVKAIIEITVPLDGVSVDDEAGVKQDAVGDLHGELADVLPDSFAQCVSASHWEDVRPTRKEAPMAELTERQSSVLGVVRRASDDGRRGRAPVSAASVRSLAWWADAPSVDAALCSLTRRGLLSKPRRGYYLPTEEKS